jgi:hypothetical protein
MPFKKLDRIIRAAADFHPFYAVDPAVFSRSGSAVLLAGAHQVEQSGLQGASAVPDAQPAKVSVDAEPVDCEAAPLVLLPVDCLVLTEADSQAQRMADRCAVEAPVPHSALAYWPLADCSAQDDSVPAGCSGSALVD